MYAVVKFYLVNNAKSEEMRERYSLCSTLVTLTKFQNLEEAPRIISLKYLILCQFH